MKLHIHSGAANTIIVTADSIDVEINPGQQSTYNAMIPELAGTLRSIGYPRLEDVSEALWELTRNNKLWSVDGKWIGPYSRTFTHTEDANR